MVHFFWLIIQKLSRRREFFRRYHQRRQVSQKKLQSEISRQDRQVEAQQDNWEDLQKI